MPVLVRSVMTDGEPTVQTSVWGSTHMNVGWFDDVDSTLDLARCAELGVDVVRRQFYGGGTAYYEREATMMWGILLPKGYGDTSGSAGLDDQLRRFQTVISDALDRVGLAEVQFEGSSDLRWHGRKLGALTAQDVVGCDSIGGFLNLHRPDLTTYLEVVRVPEDKFKDKLVKDMSEYVCTADEVAGRPVAYEDLCGNHDGRGDGRRRHRVGALRAHRGRAQGREQGLGRAAIPSMVSARRRRRVRQGFQLERYEPTPAGSWFFGVVHPWYSSTRWFAGGFTLDYAHNPLLAGLFDNNGNFHQTAAVVEHMLVGHFDVAGSFLDRVQINASLPVTFMERGSTQFGVSPLDRQARRSAIHGWARLVRLYGQPDRDPFSLSLGGYVWISHRRQQGPSQGDKTARGLPELIAAGLIKNHIRYAFNLGFLIRAESSIGFGPSSAGTELQAALGVAYADVQRRFQVGPELLFRHGHVVGDHAFKNYFTNLDILLGGQYNIARLINIGAAVGVGTLSELGTPDARVIFRVAYAPIREEKKAPPDTDKDGHPINPEDACPTEPGPRTNNPKTNGCPDRDNDGIPDSGRSLPGTADRFAAGCRQEGLPCDRRRSRRSAGLDGSVPRRERRRSSGSEASGLSVYRQGQRRCRRRRGSTGNTPGKYPDSEAARLPAARRRRRRNSPTRWMPAPTRPACPTRPTTGRTAAPRVELKVGTTTELKMVNFEVNKWVLLPESFAVLDAVAKNLNEHLEWAEIRIEGHADDTGTAAWTLRLSKHRAQAVMEYLITKGVKRSRLDYVGYGDTKPLVAGRTVGRGARQKPPRRDSDPRPQVVVVDYGWYLNSNG